MARHISSSGRAPVPPTEGIKYAGSKLKLLPYILQMTSGLGIRSALDAFSGTTRVAQAFAQSGYDTTANDVAEWSKVFATCYLLSTSPDSYYQPMIDELNSLPGRHGWFAEHYGGSDADGRRPFQLKNAMRLDAIREQIDSWQLTWTDKCVLLTSLIIALDAVDNTVGHYAAYLKGWSARSYHDLWLRLPRRFPIRTRNTVLQGDAMAAAGTYHDLVYLDPPYGSHNDKMPPSRVRYAAYYHLWKTVVLNDRPQLFGKANRREDTRDTACPSAFEAYAKDGEGHSVAMQAVSDLVQRTAARYILLSYGSCGRVTKQELFDIIEANGKLIDAREIDYRLNAMSAMRRTNEWVTSGNTCTEYLFLMEKQML